MTCKVWLSVLVLSFIAISASAQPSDMPERINLRQLMALLDTHSPVLQAERGEAEVVRAQRVRAGLLPRPELSYEDERHWRGENTVDGFTQELMFEQELPIGGQRRARITAAEQRISEVEAEFLALRESQLHELRQLYVQLLSSQHRLERIESVMRDLRNSEEVVAGRVEEGVISRFDLLRIQVELADVETQLRGQRSSRDDTAARIGLLLGESQWSPWVVGELMPLGLQADADTLWAHAQDSLPALQAARRSAERALSEVVLAEREALPVPVFGVGTMRTRHPYSRGLMLSLSVDIPIFGRRDSDVGEARAESSLAQARAGALQQRARGDLLRAVRRLESQQQTLAFFQTSVFDQLDELREMSEQAYLEGQLSIVELLDAFSTLLDAQLDHADLLEAVMLAELEVLAASGMLEEHLESAAES